MPDSQDHRERPAGEGNRAERRRRGKAASQPQAYGKVRDTGRRDLQGPRNWSIRKGG
jgi:hypothetical protein